MTLLFSINNSTFSISGMAKLRRPPLTDKTMSGLIELVSIVDSGDPITLLGDDPRDWEGTQQGTELKNRWEAIEAACKWINQLQKYKTKKTRGK